MSQALSVGMLMSFGSVDHKTDELVQRIIREEFAYHTIIVIVQCLEIILDFDRVVVLHKGELRECDSVTWNA